MENGRAITSLDLFRRRRFFETCAGLSADAALLAVLVDRLRGRERIEIHPGDLVEDVRRRLGRQATSRTLGARFIGDRLRHLGFRRAGRDRRGLRYEIRWDQVWRFDPREVSRERVDLLGLDGARLLRLLMEEGSVFFAPQLWCPRCRHVTATLVGDWRAPLEQGEVHFPCETCGGPTELLDPEWLERASVRVRRAVRHDSGLLAEVKTEWEALRGGASFPKLPEPFGWLTAAWERAPKARHRPFDPLVCYQLAHVVGQLEAAGVAREKILELLGEPDRRHREKLCESLPEPRHRSLAGSLTAGLPSVNRMRLEEAVRWASQQWTNPMARVRGDRPIRGKPARADLAQRPNSQVPASCPKCKGSRLLHEYLPGGIVRVSCPICGWDAFPSHSACSSAS